MNTVIGIDEVGRGAWAGPLLVVAVRQKMNLSPNITDSKLLSRTARGSLVAEIRQACDIGEGWVMPVEIDKYGLSDAMRIGVERALDAIDAWKNERIIMDGNINYCSPEYFKATAVVGADKMFPVVSAASIIAKVARDKYMSELPERYGIYQFDRHVGYGTALHQKLLLKYGISDMHRRSFKPIKAML